MAVFNKHLKSGIFILTTFLIAVGTANARTINYKRTDSTITTTDIAKDNMVGHAVPYIYDVKVDNTQLVRGTAVGNYRDVEELMRFAVNDAMNKLAKAADILTRAEYEYQQKDTILTVNVVGYPGYYVNYRPITDMNNDGAFDSSNYWRMCDYQTEIKVIGGEEKNVFVHNPEHKHTKECLLTRFDILMAEYGNPHGKRIPKFGLDNDSAKYISVGYNANFPYSYAGVSVGFGFSINRFYLNVDAEFGYGGHILRDGDEHFIHEDVNSSRHDLTFGGNLAAYGCVFSTNRFDLLIGGRIGYTGLSSTVKHTFDDDEGDDDTEKEKFKGAGIGGPSVRFDIKINDNLYFSPSYSVMFGDETMQRVFIGFSRQI